VLFLMIDHNQIWGVRFVIGHGAALPQVPDSGIAKTVPLTAHRA